MKNSNVLWYCILGVISLPIGAVAGDRRICFESTSDIVGAPTVTGDYQVTANKGEIAAIVGQDCVTLPGTGQEECMPGSGTFQYSNGKLEIDATGSNKLAVTEVGDVFTLSESFIELDPNTLQGTGTMLLTTIVNGVATESVQTTSVKAISCPKVTSQDKENIKGRNRVLRKLDNL